MSPLYCLVFLYAVHTTQGAFRWSNCLPNKHDIEISTLVVEPDPIVMPGDVKLRINGRTTRNITSATLKIEAKRKTFLGEVHIPCLFNVGSCEYPDICTIVDRMQKENWGGISTGLGTDVQILLEKAGIYPIPCPLPPTQLDVQNGTLHLPDLSGILKAFSSGDYHFNIKVTETATQEEVMCLDLYLKLEESCSGIGCFIGRK